MKFIIHGTPDTFYGSKIEPIFLQKDFMDESNLVKRLIPFVNNEIINSTSVFCSEEDRKNFKSGFIAAQPDAVLSHPNYDIVVEFKSLAGSRKKVIDNSNWKKNLRLKDVLQAITGSLQVSIIRNKPAITVLRYMNSIYIIYPSQELIQFMIREMPKIYEYKKVPNDKYISATTYIEQLEVDVSKKFSSYSENNERAKEKGKEIHDKMLAK